MDNRQERILKTYKTLQDDQNDLERLAKSNPAPKPAAGPTASQADRIRATYEVFQHQEQEAERRRAVALMAKFDTLDLMTAQARARRRAAGMDGPARDPA